MPAQFESSPGRQIVRHFDAKGRLEKTIEINEAPDGKRHDKELDASGTLVKEDHGYMQGTKRPFLKILLSRTYERGRVYESYIVKDRLVSRKSYEKARANFPSMPPPDTSIEDHNAGLLRMVAAERRGRRAAAKTDARDPRRGHEHDAFCRKLMAEGASADATTWVKERHHTLGEMDEPASRRLVSRLMKLGCVAVTACKVDSYDDGQANTGHLVVELPDDGATRAKILRAVDRLAEQQGYGGDVGDDGQRLCYVKLD